MASKSKAVKEAEKKLAEAKKSLGSGQQNNSATKAAQKALDEAKRSAMTPYQQKKDDEKKAKAKEAAKEAAKGTLRKGETSNTATKAAALGMSVDEYKRTPEYKAKKAKADAQKAKSSSKSGSGGKGGGGGGKMGGSVEDYINSIRDKLGDQLNEGIAKVTQRGGAGATGRSGGGRQIIRPTGGLLPTDEQVRSGMDAYNEGTEGTGRAYAGTRGIADSNAQVAERLQQMRQESSANQASFRAQREEERRKRLAGMGGY